MLLFVSNFVYLHVSSNTSSECESNRRKGEQTNVSLIQVYNTQIIIRLNKVSILVLRMRNLSWSLCYYFVYQTIGIFNILVWSGYRLIQPHGIFTSFRDWLQFLPLEMYSEIYKQRKSKGDHSKLKHFTKLLPLEVRYTSTAIPREITQNNKCTKHLCLSRNYKLNWDFPFTSWNLWSS